MLCRAREGRRGARVDLDGHAAGLRPQGPALRPRRRGALQPHQRPAQVAPQLRRRRRPLLARADAGGRRGPALHRATPGALRLGGRGAGRPPGPGRWPWPRSRPCTSSACPKGPWPWPSSSSTWRRRPGATRVYKAYGEAARPTPSTTRAEPPPLQIRNAPTGLMKTLGYGAGLRYAHDEAEGVAEMDCLPESLAGGATTGPRRGRRGGPGGAARGRAPHPRAEEASAAPRLNVSSGAGRPSR